jgi:pilus assembly protein CpaE
MYLLDALLIGCAEEVLPSLRRELKNLSVAIEGEFTDVRSCLTHVLATPVEKQLFIIQPRSAADVISLERLNESIAGRPILALVDPAADPSLMVRAMRAGAAQVVRVPLEPDDFRAAMHRITVQFGYSQHQSRAICVFGASEGSGSTTIALNLASEIGRLQHTPCLLAEGSVIFGRLANYLGIEPQLTMHDLASDIETLDLDRFRQALTKVEDNLLILAGSYRALTPFTLTTDTALKLLCYAKQVAEVVIVDGRYNFEELDFEFASQVQQIVLVGTTKLTSLFGLKLLLASFATRGLMAEQFVVINQFDAASTEFSHRRLEEILGVPKVFTVVADPVSMLTAENEGKPLRQAVPRSHALADISALAHSMMRIPVEASHGGGWSLRKMWNNVTRSLASK